MADTYIKGGLVYLDRRFREATLRLSGGKVYVLPAAAPTGGGEVVDARGRRVVPGFLDLHTHGGVGVDVNHATARDLGKLSAFFAAHGVTAFLMSVLTDTEEKTLWCLEQYKALRAHPAAGAQLLGVHLEGPFLAPAYKGAMPEHLLREGDPALAARYQQAAEGGVRYITVSPEVPGVPALIPALRALGITVAIGHSGADYAAAIAAIDAGAAAATHTGNAMRLLHQHEPAILGAVLEREEVTCEMICDGRHLHPGMVRLLCRAKGLDRLVAITDSIMAAGLPDGNYKLGVNDVIVSEGDAKLPDGTRAGSTLTLDAALRNILRWTGLPLEEVLPLFTENPARLIGVFDRKGSIADGKDADLVLLDGEARVDRVCVRGSFLPGGGA